MKPLFLEDLKDMTLTAVKEHILSSYQAAKSVLNKYDILIAYESVGAYGCDSSSFFMLQDKETGKFAVATGSHCSCYGFEGQFSPEIMPKKWWKESLANNGSPYWSGGYDNDSDGNQSKVKERIKKILETI